jgi:predicted DNA-binding protein (MmcQ/YjbR family)
VASRQPNARVLARLRKVCLSLPEAEEIETWGHPTFRVRKKIFVGCGASDEGRVQMTCKAPPGEQRALVSSDPSRFFVPAYVGNRGWVGMWLDGPVDWDEVAELVEESYRLTAPKKLSALLDE